MRPHKLKCQNCGYIGTYTKEDARNVGTFGTSENWQVTCSQCKQGINLGESSKQQKD